MGRRGEGYCFIVNSATEFEISHGRTNVTFVSLTYNIQCDDCVWT